MEPHSYPESNVWHLSRNNLPLLQSVYARFVDRSAKLLLDKYLGIKEGERAFRFGNGAT
jgi:hypothetical protein